jgi:glycosyltransferase involved in cell wall biosynthesis
MIDQLQPTRVVHLLAPTQGAGLEQVVAMLSVGQRSEGVHVVLVLTPAEAEDHPYSRRLSELGVAFTKVVVPGRSYLREYREINALLKRLAPQVLHTHGYRADLIGIVVARRNRIPLVSTVHGFTGATVRIRVNERVQCLILRRADAVIAVSIPLVERLAGAGISRDKIHYVPNGFLPTLVSLDRSQAREKLGITAGRLVAGWVGRLSTEKGADVMLDALSLTSASWQLELIGDGPERQALEHQTDQLGIADRVRWHGSIPSAAAVLSAFDAFVLSSRTEGTPIALLEAMHAGVPIIATRVGGVPDVVTSAHALLIPSEQPETIASALAEIEHHRSAAQARSQLAHERLHTTFGAERWLASIESVYEAASTSSRRASPRRA